MEYIGRYIFNRGQTITVFKGPKSYRVSYQLWNTEGNPFKHIVGKDGSYLTQKAFSAIKEDVAKDGQELVLRESDGEPFPFRVKTEDEQLQEFVQSKGVQEIIQGIKRRMKTNKVGKAFGLDEEERRFLINSFEEEEEDMQ